MNKIKVAFLWSLSIFLLMIFSDACTNEENTNNKNFAIKNSNDITKIKMFDKTGDSIILEKTDQYWIINKKYKVWQKQIDYTLKVMEDIKIKSSVSEEMEQMAIKNIATSGVRIDIYTNNKISKSYYIGGNTSDHMGTYMIMKGGNSPFIMHIPDRNPGILNPKYGLEGNTVNETVWREPITIAINPNSITEIKVTDLINNNQSFSINMNNKKLTNINKEIINVEIMKLHTFCSYFEKLECGKFNPNIQKEDLSLIKSIHIKHDNEIANLNIYEKKEFQKNIRRSNPTVEILYGTWNKSDILIIQKNIFNKVLITLDEFIE